MIQREDAPTELSGHPDAAGRPLEATIADVCARIVGVEHVDVEAEFLDVVTDSVQLIQVVSRLREAIHPDLPLQLFYVAPTIAGIAREVEQFLVTAPAADESEEGEL